MEITELKKRPEIAQNEKATRAYNQLNKLLSELGKHKLPNKIVTFLNHEIKKLNSASALEKKWVKQVRKTQTNIARLAEKELKLVTKNHYRNTWLAIGMVVFGVPIGMVFQDVGLTIGIVAGMAVGVLIGSRMDNDALKKGKQLNLELKR